MSYFSLYVLSLLILLQQQRAVDTKSVEEKSLIQSYQEFKSKHESCSLINNTQTHKHFQELCKDKTIPDPTKVDDDSLLFDTIPYLCYTVLHNLKTACLHTDQNFTQYPVNDDPGKFCSSFPKIEIQKNCSPWLEDQDKAETDCVLVSKVARLILNTTTCNDSCIKSERIDPLCQDLVQTLLILKDLSNKSSSSVTVTAPQPSKELDPKKVDTTKQSTQKEQKKDKNSEEKVQEKEDGKHDKSSDPSEAAKDTATVSTSISSNSTTTQAEVKEEAKSKSEEKAEVKSQEKEEKVDKEEEGEGEVKSKSGEEIELSDATDLSSGEAGSVPEQKYEGSISSDPSSAEAQSRFFTYFSLLFVVSIVAYLVFHNKQKVR